MLTVELVIEVGIIFHN